MEEDEEDEKGEDEEEEDYNNNEEWEAGGNEDFVDEEATADDDMDEGNISEEVLEQKDTKGIHEFNGNMMKTVGRLNMSVSSAESSYFPLSSTSVSLNENRQFYIFQGE